MQGKYKERRVETTDFLSIPTLFSHTDLLSPMPTLDPNSFLSHSELSRPLSLPGTSRANVKIKGANKQKMNLINNTYVSSRKMLSNEDFEISQFSEELESKMTKSKESIRNIIVIKKKEEEKSRMLNTFIPRPSYTKWIQIKKTK